jgi:hypothetical protein
VVRAALEHFGVQVELEGVARQQSGLAHRPELHRVQEQAAVAGRADEDRDRHAMAGGEQPFVDAGVLLLRGVDRAQQIAQLGAGHLLLELGQLQAAPSEAVLIEQHALVEGHVGDRIVPSSRSAPSSPKIGTSCTGPSS